MRVSGETIPPGLIPSDDVPTYPRHLNRKRPDLLLPEVDNAEIDKSLAIMFPTESSRRQIPQSQYGRRLVVHAYMRLISLARGR